MNARISFTEIILVGSFSFFLGMSSMAVAIAAWRMWLWRRRTPPAPWQHTAFATTFALTAIVCGGSVVFLCARAMVPALPPLMRFICMAIGILAMLFGLVRWQHIWQKR